MTAHLLKTLFVALLFFIAPTLRSEAQTVEKTPTMSQAPVSASDGWIRWLPGNAPMAAYMLLKNQGDDSVTLMSASSPRFEQVMLHESVDQGGMSQMKMVETLSLPPHHVVAIAPGGYHLMLMTPRAPVAVGDQIMLTLTFSNAQVLTVTLPVSPPTRLH